MTHPWTEVQRAKAEAYLELDFVGNESEIESIMNTAHNGSVIYRDHIREDKHGLVHKYVVLLRGGQRDYIIFRYRKTHRSLNETERRVLEVEHFTYYKDAIERYLVIRNEYAKDDKAGRYVQRRIHLP